MAEPVAHDIDPIYRGDDYAHCFVFLEADGTERDVSSGYTFAAKAKSNLNGTLVATFTCANPAADMTFKVEGEGSVTYAKESIIVLSLTGTVTGAIDSDYSELVYDFQQTVSGAVTTLTEGKVLVRGQVTS